MVAPFPDRLAKKVGEQIRAIKVGFLLGAGSSYLNGSGYPLSADLWNCIKNDVPEDQRSDIQAKLDAEDIGLEKALDLLDSGMSEEGPHRHSVTNAIAKYFINIKPELTLHRQFLSTLANRGQRKVNIFSLNYDPLVERSAEAEHVRVVDGFIGHESAYFDPSVFDHDLAVIQIGHRGALRRPIQTWIQLVKLHGSLGWFDDPNAGFRRRHFDAHVVDPTKRLMIPPQHRKAAETVTPPYARLWSEFRKSLVHGPDTINRLVCMGYGMADEHVNAVIESALARTNFTLVVATKSLSDAAFSRWSQYQNALLITAGRSAFYGEVGVGNPSLSTFEGIVEELMK